MSLKAKPSTYRIGLAPTSRARCRGRCKRLISKGELRIVITAFVLPGRATALSRCVRCIDGAFAKAVLAVYGCTTRIPIEPGVAEEDAVRVCQSLECCRRKITQN